jgi:hypothetical protein
LNLKKIKINKKAPRNLQINKLKKTITKTIKNTSKVSKKDGPALAITKIIRKNPKFNMLIKNKMFYFTKIIITKKIIMNS